MVPIMNDEMYMREALKMAKKALALGEIPVGAIVVYQDKIIGRGYNRRESKKDVSSHAEIEARLGPSVKPHLARYKRAFLVFFAVIGAIMALAITFTFVKTA